MSNRCRRPPRWACSAATRCCRSMAAAAADVIADDDFSALTAAAASDRLTLELRRGGAQRTVTIGAAVFTLTPVSGTAVLDVGARPQAGLRGGQGHDQPGLGAAGDGLLALQRPKACGDVVLDLRYNGGGLVSTGGTVASYIAGARGRGRRYATLLYNDRRAASNQSFRFAPLSSALGLPRVYVLIGPAHLFGQRAGDQRPARHRRRGGGDRRDQLRQAGGLLAGRRLRPHLQRDQLRERERPQRGPLLRWLRCHLPGGRGLHGAPRGRTPIRCWPRPRHYRRNGDCARPQAGPRQAAIAASAAAPRPSGRATSARSCSRADVPRARAPYMNRCSPAFSPPRIT